MIRECRFILVLTFAGACLCRAALVFTGGYSQDFNSLASSGTGNNWTDNSTISGWYASESGGTLSSYNASAGTSSAGGLWSFGSSGSSERALGALPSGTTGNIFWGAAFQNDTAGTIMALQIVYTGEQWRDGAQGTLQFAYYIGDPSSISSAGWTTVSSLTFSGLKSDTGSNSSTESLDGNSSANSTGISFTISGLTVSSGSDFWIRWEDDQQSGYNSGLAIDNFSIQAVPELPAWGASAGAGLLALCVWRVWRQYRYGEKLKS
jgi:hypothetical protein